MRIKNNRKTVKAKQNISAGFSLLEVVVAIFIATLIGLAALSLLNARAVGVLDNQDVQEAETRAEEALSTLTAIAPDLQIGGSFEVIGDNRVKVTGDCDDQSCDYVLFPAAPENLQTSPAKGFPYSTKIPEGSQIMFLRRWRVDETDSEYGLRKITLAVLKTVKSDQPMVLEDAIEPLSR